MRAGLCGSLVVCLSLGLAGPVQADEPAEIKPVLDKAIKAMGGEEKLAKVQSATTKAKVTLKEGGTEITIVVDGGWADRDKLRLDADIQINGMSMKALLIVNSDKGWMQKDNKTEDAPANIVPFIKDLLYALRTPQLLAGLKDKAFQLSHLGEVKIADRAAVGLRLAHKDHKDVSLFLDKETGLPVKSEIRLTDPQGKEITVEYNYGDYKDLAGLKHPAKITIKVDDKELVMELSELKTEKVDDSQFAKP